MLDKKKNFFGDFLDIDKERIKIKTHTKAQEVTETSESNNDTQEFRIKLEDNMGKAPIGINKTMSISVPVELLTIINKVVADEEVRRGKKGLRSEIIVERLRKVF